MSSSAGQIATLESLQEKAEQILSRWQVVELPGRGRAFACDIPGPSPSAPTVVLLHGLMATGLLNWGPYLEPLSQQFRVVVVDHRGHGRGLRHDDPFTLEDCADDVVALADVLGVRGFIAVGYSMGGPIAQLVWHRHPQRVEGLVLCATAADFQTSSPERLVLQFLDSATRLVPPVMRDQALRLLVQGRVSDPTVRQLFLEEVKGHDDASIREAARATLKFSSTEWISGISLPTAVVVTENDLAVLPARQRELAGLIPNADVISIRADHSVCFTRPDVFGPAVIAACMRVADQLGKQRRGRAPQRWWRRFSGRHRVRQARRQAGSGRCP
jgi:3-oxoadipate enol-lactonase